MEKKNTEIETEIAKEDLIDPQMRFDALMGGVKDGGLRSVASINLIVSYIVANLSGKITAEIIATAMAQGQLANYFEVKNAIAKLLNSHTIVENEDGALSINKTTNADIDLVEKDLPYTVRVRSIELCQKMIAKEQYKKENKTAIIPTGDHFTVELHISGDSDDFMQLKLFAPTIEQAEMIKEKFLTDPAKVYETVIAAIFQNEE